MKRSVSSSPQAIDPRSNPNKGPCGIIYYYKTQKNPPKTPYISSNFDLNGLGLLGLRRWQLLNGDGQHPILTYKDC